MTGHNAIVAALDTAVDGALFVTELAAQVRQDQPSVDAALRDLVAEGRCLIVKNTLDDPHVTGDLRVVALLTYSRGPRHAAESCARVWDLWLREFLRLHRCS